MRGATLTASLTLKGLILLMSAKLAGCRACDWCIRAGETRRARGIASGCLAGANGTRSALIIVQIGASLAAAPAGVQSDRLARTRARRNHMEWLGHDRAVKEHLQKSAVPMQRHPHSNLVQPITDILRLWELSTNRKLCGEAPVIGLAGQAMHHRKTVVARGERDVALFAHR